MNLLQERILKMEDKFSQVKSRIVDQLSRELDLLKRDIIAEFQNDQQEYQEVKQKLEVIEKERSSQTESKSHIETQYLELQNKMDMLFDIVHLCHKSMIYNKNNTTICSEAARLLEEAILLDDGKLMLALLNTFVNIPHDIFQLDMGGYKQLLSTIIKVFDIQFIENKEEIYFIAIQLINRSTVNDEINLLEVFNKSKRSLDSNVYECFYLPLTIELMSTYLSFNLKSDFSALFDDMLMDFDYWSNQLTETSFNKLLWYGFFVDSDKEFIVEIYQLHNNLINNIETAKKIYDVVNNMFNTAVNNDTTESVIMAFNGLELFTIKEKKEITDKIKERLDNGLKKENGKEIISNKEFKWPSTEVLENKLTNKNEHNSLNDTSDLRKLGYQITNLNREKRWEVLEKAVPTLGLRKVAYTIASNVKLRKGQKNGKIKFGYSISEWEYDLERLKKQYYKKDFVWPNT